GSREADPVTTTCSVILTGAAEVSCCPSWAPAFAGGGVVAWAAAAWSAANGVNRTMSVHALRAWRLKHDARDMGGLLLTRLFVDATPPDHDAGDAQEQAPRAESNDREIPRGPVREQQGEI